jgi:SAM-dependent methyltransferase
MSSNQADVREVVRDTYAKAALRVRSGENGYCGDRAPGDCSDPITSNLYATSDAADVPKEALQASFGCGNPTALAELKPGETVLDLGSGGGIDVLLSARRIGPTGVAYGLDMTDEMLALAQENRRRSGLANVHFLKGEIENIPLPANSVDVIISNCVINLSDDKDRVLREAFRVLRPGGRFAVSDVVVRGEVPTAIRKSIELWAGCVAGALTDGEYSRKLHAMGFTGIDIEVTREYRADDARAFLAAEGVDADAIANEVDGKFVSAFVRAVKPAVAVASTTSVRATEATDAGTDCCTSATPSSPSQNASGCCAAQRSGTASPSTKGAKCCA